MPDEFIIDGTHAVVVSRGTGVFASADFLSHMARLHADPRFNPDFNHLVDCRGFTALNFTAEEVKGLAGRSVFSVRSRRAFVVNTDLHFGLSRMFAAYRETAGAPGVRSFREMGPALAWLQLPPEFDPTAGNAAQPRRPSTDLDQPR